MKKGDKVICVKSRTSLIINTLYTFNLLTEYGVCVYEKPNLIYPKNCFKLVLKSNKLNRKLYPDATEVSGYLRID